MNHLDSSLLCLDLASTAVGYRALDSLTRSQDLRILEASTSGAGRFLILALGSFESLNDGLQDVRSSLDGADVALFIDSELIKTPEPGLLDSMYSLAQQGLEESLVVLECSTVSGLVALSQQIMEQHRLKAIEIKIHRGGACGGVAFFTGSTEACGPASELARTRLRHDLRAGRVEQIDAPAMAFRRFFDLKG